MPDSASFQDALRERVLVFDGAMGTEIYRHHVFTNRCYDELCLSEPKLIRQIHSGYCQAGADVLTTNTFGANRVALGRFGLADRLAEIHRAGARLAREVADAADRTVFVAGSIGPLPPQPQYAAEWTAMIVEQVEALMAGGADLILFETLPNRDSLEQCALAMAAAPGVPFALSFALTDQEETVSGESLQRMLAPMPEGAASPIALGMNCGTGPAGLLGALERAIRLTSLPLVVQPNAGIPKEVDNRKIYLCSPEYLTTYALRFVQLGARAVGGCCGTTPEHIREISRAVKPLSRARVVTVVREAAEEVEEQPPTPRAERSRLACRLAMKKWVTSVELVPPRGYDLKPTIDKCLTLYRHGVDAVNIPDGPRASARISPLVTAERVLREAGIEPILHFCSRDRNLIGIQADLLACAACGVRNILFVTGDPPKLGNYPHATGVFDTDSIGMVAVQRRLNSGIDLGGQAIEPKTEALLGVGLDPTAVDRQRELDRFQRKVEAGAEFAITQPVFDPDALLRFLDEVEKHGIPIMAGIWPLASYRNALFMQNEVPGVEIPAAVLQRMEAAGTREEQMQVGIEIARQSVQRVHDRVAGIQVSAPFGKIETALAVIEGWEAE
ncbi:MAG: bifunctional homocysteine S-methyltransferase/methylenetetrahydrofolate reductase [Pirellulales bacterium]|nr:bifunctional homocysteine S-methyltransferase/methylenetetrahydrofolate reductase [Thermoguttaceae bacterium]MDD4789066.1 bifunctional homocysteine S-methyltransferase/methylenetetrahydrofolate reductase [Pirellulales bacterium]MDI9446591.1 bifunctional homocysteine S-methyltransferase/methylenetetrahydrofolate reductase [Planctomycetota bacterium]NLY99641.1 bifunctional homocysteine S-methyltransferase/methylenetetrahydrofolate reductase [Pirellulaceae bacterium]